MNNILTTNEFIAYTFDTFDRAEAAVGMLNAHIKKFGCISYFDCLDIISKFSECKTDYSNLSYLSGYYGFTGNDCFTVIDIPENKYIIGYKLLELIHGDN